MPVIRFGDHEVEVVKGRDMLTQLLAKDVPIMYVCMSGNCGTCRVEVVSGGEHLEPMNEAELFHFPQSKGEVRLACQAIAKATGDIQIRQ